MYLLDEYDNPIGGYFPTINDRWIAWVEYTDQAHILDVEDEAKLWVERHADAESTQNSVRHDIHC